MLLSVLWLMSAAGAAQSGPEPSELFEQKIRPLLVERCYACHSATLPQPMGGLRLDTREGLLRGGTRGPALVPGKPDESLLVQAVNYSDVRLRMPPTGKISDQEIADLRAWIEAGAFDPRTDQAAAPAPAPGYDFESARDFWCFQSPAQFEPPAVKNSAWLSSPIDAFILSELEKRGLSPSPPSDRGALLRRVTFDLIGLPPTPAELAEFLNDTSPDAYPKVVERLLASPHYGERWARHWLDLVRFAETNGHEFDNDKLDAWRYRDYVIRAFNDDIPYEQFVREHIAGDLLAGRRLSADQSHWESPIGTGFFWFGEVLNSATDSVKARADQVDNQLDVLGKTFLGLTVACARCHDHKFDPIPTADYYAMAGIMHSTTINETVIDSPLRAGQIAAAHQQISEINGRIDALLKPAQSALAAQLERYLSPASDLIPRKEGLEEEAARAAAASGLDAALLLSWAKRLQAALQEPSDLFHPLAVLAEQPAGPGFVEAVGKLSAALREAKDRSDQIDSAERGEIFFEDFEKIGFDGWTVSGQAFGPGPVYRLAPNHDTPKFRGGGVADSFRGADELVGSLTSLTFKAPKLYLHVRMKGTKIDDESALRVTLVADGHKSQNIRPDDNPALHWKTVRLTKEIGRLCYFEIVDRSRTGHLVVDDIVLSDSKEPPGLASAPHPQILALLQTEGLDSFSKLSLAYAELFQRILEAPALDADSRWLHSELAPSGQLEELASLLPAAQRQELAQLAGRRGAVGQSIPESAFAMTSRDQDPRDIQVHLRGSHQNLGDFVPRRFLQVLAGQEQPPIHFGSGRLQLAEWIADRQNPLTARVLVNRLWKHHFGQGLVTSVDNFGRTGDPPSHAGLLDFLAARFVESGWSLKQMHRTMVLSSAYRMSSEAGEAASAADPENKLLHHMPPRRLEGEAVRDSILAVAGTLNRQLYGPSVPPHISKYQDGRGKPKSGPLDGNGRRSIYIQVRRNFLTPLFLAFDYPLPISTIGRRSTSTVPSQSLLLLNNEFVAQQTQQWAARLLAEPGSAGGRIERMYLEAFSRPAGEDEIRQITSFLEEQRKTYQGLDRALDPAQIEQKVWADVAHVLFNSAEFIYVR